MTLRVGISVIAGVVLLAAAPARAADERALAFTFTPTERSQIAIWIESADGTFLSTVSLTQAVSVRGIGNRPGAAQMNSGYRWPYGRREGVLPIWGQHRMAAPGAVPFPRVVFQDRHEGYASQTCGDSTSDMYFCLSFTEESTHKDGLDAVSCASARLFNSDKGRFLTAADVAAGYAEPVSMSGQPAYRPLDVTSPYPPRRDFASCAVASTRGPCIGGVDDCRDHPDSATFADVARTVMPDIDAVTMATPPGDVEQTMMFSVPSSWPDGEYVAFLEVNTEGDYNASFNATNYPTPCKVEQCSEEFWDSWAIGFGYPYRGQPSVVFSVPFTLGPAGMFSTMTPVGFGSVDGTDASPGTMHPMDGSITDNPLDSNTAGSGADRLRMNATFTSRLEVEVRPCLSQAPPDAPGGVTVEPVADPKHSHDWAHLHFVAPANAAAGIARYEVRTSTDQPIVAGDATSFIRGLPAQAASTKIEALMVPVNGAPGSPVDVDFGGLNPTTHYWVGVRAVDLCNRPGPPAVAEVTTTAINYTKLSGPCFIATAAWGSALEPQVAALRRARDRLVRESGLFAAATELYYRASPPAADALRKSETARVLARRFLGPVGAAAQSVPPLR